MKIKAILYCLSAACAVTVHAENTNRFGVDTTSARLVEAMRTSTNAGIIPVFLAGSVNRFERLTEQASVPLGHHDLHELERRDAGQTFQNIGQRSFEYAARDFGEELEIWHHMGDFGDIIADSIGGVDEQITEQVNPSFQVTEQSWWKEVRQNNGMRFGIRPFGSSAYAFAAARWRLHGQDLFYTNLRVYYARSYYFNLEEPKVTLNVGIPLFDGVSMNIGTSYTYHFGGEDSRPVGSVRIQKVIHSGLLPSYAFAGLEVGQFTRVVAGLTLATR